MISEAETRVYRERLLALMSRLDQHRSQLKDEAFRPAGGEASGGLSNVPLHPADLGSHNSEEDLALGLLRNEEQLIAEINAALERLDQGLYGRCATCGREIPKERLEVLPYARHCVACARRLEQEGAP